MAGRTPEQRYDSALARAIGAAAGLHAVPFTRPPDYTQGQAELIAALFGMGPHRVDGLAAAIIRAAADRTIPPSN